MRTEVGDSTLVDNLIANLAQRFNESHEVSVYFEIEPLPEFTP